MKKRTYVLLALLWSLLQFALSGGVYAAPLSLTPTYPDFQVSSLSYSYDAITGNLTITGNVGSYSAAASPSPQLHVTTDPTNSSNVEKFSLSATLNGSGSVQSGSFQVDGLVRTFSVSGAPPAECFPLNQYKCVLYDGYTDPGGDGLLSGALVQFGWSLTSGNSGTLEFTFGNADGFIADLGYLGGGMQLHVTSSTLANFGAEALTTSWTGTGFGDVFVPVPAAVWLFGSGFLALLGVARRKAKQ